MVTPPNFVQFRPPNFVQFADALGVVYGLNVSAVCQWQYNPEVPETADREGRPSYLILTTSVNEYYCGDAADFFYAYLTGQHYKTEWQAHD